MHFTGLSDFAWGTALYNSNTTHGEVRHMVTGYIGIRLHTVIYTERGGRLRIISLRIASNRERRNYAQA